MSNNPMELLKADNGKLYLTEAFIRAGMKNGIGITNKQREILKTDERGGWIKRLVGQEISQDEASHYLELKGVRANRKEVVPSHMPTEVSSATPADDTRLVAGYIIRAQTSTEIKSAVTKGQQIANITENKRLIIHDSKAGLVKELMNNPKSVKQDKSAPFYIIEIRP